MSAMKLRPLAVFALFVTPLLIAIGPSEPLDVEVDTVLAPITGCTHQQLKTAKDIQDAVLKGADLLCVLAGAGSGLDDPQAVATACHLIDKLDLLLPVLRDLIPVRNAARRAGVVYRSSSTGIDAR
jgi:hypothetical protein